jgi:Ca2+-binding RTX toxin-like protein
VLKGGSGDDVIDGRGGADTVFGGGGNDTITYYDAVGASLSGGADNDTLILKVGASVNLSQADQTIGDNTVVSGFENLDASGAATAITLTVSAAVNVLKGGTGDDVIEGKGGGDTVDGGFGNDTASYASSPAGVNVSLAAGTGLGGDAQGDTLTGIENLIGSAYKDILTGDSGNNILTGGAGADTLVGGLGEDTADYSSAPADPKTGQGVTVNLTSGVNHFSDAEGDKLSGIENVRGSAYADSLVGDGNANKLWGGIGNDVLSGNAGKDTLVGGLGNDTLTGGTDSDTFVFGLQFGKDVVTDFQASGAGHDVIQFDSTLFADTAAVLSHAQQVGKDVVITYDSADTVTLKGVTLLSLQLHPEDFVLA